MSDVLLNKLKSIDASRRNLKAMLLEKGVDLSESNLSLDSLIGNVAHLRLDDDVDPDPWEGVTPVPEPQDYYKGDDDWVNLIDIDDIMENDPYNYTGKIFYLIRCSENSTLDDYSTGYTNRAIVYSATTYFRFSDQDDTTDITTQTTTAHAFDPTKDIVASNGERFRWIIAYTNTTNNVIMWQGAYLIPEAVVYWSGTYRGICFEDCPPGALDSTTSSAKLTQVEIGYAYRNGNNYAYYGSFNMTNYNSNYCRVICPKYFEMKPGVETDFITGQLARNCPWSGSLKTRVADYRSEENHHRCKTIINDGICHVEFCRRPYDSLSYQRHTNPGYSRYLVLDSGYWDGEQEHNWCYANVSQCAFVWIGSNHGYVRLEGNMPRKSCLFFGRSSHLDILADDVGSISINAANGSTDGTAYNYNWWMNTRNDGGFYAAEGSEHFNFECGDINGSVGYSAFRNFNGHVKFGKIYFNINRFAFASNEHIPTEIIVERPQDSSSTFQMGYGAFAGTNVEKIDLRDSGITSFEAYGENPYQDNTNYATDRRQPFYGAEYLRILYLPKNCISLPAYSFSHLYSLEQLILPENLVTISSNCFDSDVSLQAVEIPSTIQTIGQYAFSSCLSLKSLIINADQNVSIGNYAFASCVELETVQYPQYNTSIPEHCFDSCRRLTNFVLPHAVINIYAYAFYNCRCLERVIFDNPAVANLQNIGTNAFCFCFNLVEIPDINNLVESVNSNQPQNPFFNCESLTITLRNTKPTNMNETYYNQQFYNSSCAHILCPPDYSYTANVWLKGCNWDKEGMEAFLYSLPDRTGQTACVFSLGADYRNCRFTGSTGNQPYVAAYNIWSVIYRDQYCKEIDGALQIRPDQPDNTWITCLEYVQNKNITIYD